MERGEEEIRRIDKVSSYLNFTQHKEHPNSACTIFKVPEHIRRLDPEAYTPMAASFGPFHHHRPYAISFDHKWRSVRRLLLRHGGSEHAKQVHDECLLKLKKRDNDVRICYSEEFPELDDQVMAEIMLLDGCFIIDLMFKIDAQKKQMQSKKTKAEEQPEGPTLAGLSPFYLAVYDVLKLENQIPFFIIELLFDHLKTPEDGRIDLVDLALQLFDDVHPEKFESFQKKPPNEYHHLLHLFYSSRISRNERRDENQNRNRDMTKRLASAPRWTPSAMELDRAGVKFEVKKGAHSFLDITFKVSKSKIVPCLKSGRMEIPRLQIYDYTNPLFRNLIAFEQCYPNTEMCVTIYALFMDSIIDQAEDVRLLRLKHILEHKLSNNQAVAKLFNQLGGQIHFFWFTNYLTDQIIDVVWNVNRFYELKWRKRLAGLRRDYLYSPWAIISVLAAIILLLLTIEQATFSALSYFDSP